MGRRGDSPIYRAQGRTLSSLSRFLSPSTVYPGIPPLNLNQRLTPLRPDPLSINLVPWSAPTLSYRGSLYSKFPISLPIIPALIPYLLPFKDYPTFFKCGSLTPVTPLCLPSPHHQISLLLLPHQEAPTMTLLSNGAPPIRDVRLGCKLWPKGTVAVDTPSSSVPGPAAAPDYRPPNPSQQLWARAQAVRA